MTDYSSQSQLYALYPAEYFAKCNSLKELLGKSNKTPNENAASLHGLAYQLAYGKLDSCSHQQKLQARLIKYFNRLESYVNEPKELRQVDQKLVVNFFAIVFLNARHFLAEAGSKVR